ncbi:conserved hypothetical protein [Talaromyces stipitatus ATCC 10500]|uniref:Uncharacterized protein n=1 Tax=Talaromyces stipitatus (strain ATCC 10500 / CBS 375.48 / QM 6759 / NRRL 1006) TaxID=441959 RepID=B8M6J9_TALSN|nr:uncharacterized protein TSTA_027550 [Talaromyces stipitatus ATCC 10500]EED19461.1 conserved hypothetical protein [Talaromyces stipitatus ATCC 10500]
MSLSTDISSPFKVPAEVMAVLEHDEAFQSLRQHCSESSSLCPFHNEECSEQQRAVFQLHRDVIYTLLLPLFEIHNQATQIATRVLGRRQGTEPERAFRGQARGAFTWLHCILTEERDFCLAEGCPACIVLHVLSSEPTIRLVTVACLLCDFLSSTDFAVQKLHHGHPDFGFWLEAMENAVREDPLWGEAFWPEIRHRAESLAVDIKYLIMQCVELRTGTELQRTSSTASSNSSAKSSCSVTMRSDRHAYRVHVRSIPVQPSALARRQLNMMWEEQELVSKFLLQGYLNSLCWSDRHRKMLEFSKTGSLYLSPGTI